MAVEHLLELVIGEPVPTGCTPNDGLKVGEAHLALCLELRLAHHLQEIVEGAGLARCVGSQKLLDLLLDSEVVGLVIHQLWWCPPLDGRALHDGAEPINPPNPAVPACLRGANVASTAPDVRGVGLLQPARLLQLPLRGTVSSDERHVVRLCSPLDNIAQLGLRDPTEP